MSSMKKPRKQHDVWHLILPFAALLFACSAWGTATTMPLFSSFLGLLLQKLLMFDRCSVRYGSRFQSYVVSLATFLVSSFMQLLLKKNRKKKISSWWWSYCCKQFFLAKKLFFSLSCFIFFWLCLKCHRKIVYSFRETKLSQRHGV